MSVVNVNNSSELLKRKRHFPHERQLRQYPQHKSSSKGVNYEPDSRHLVLKEQLLPEIGFIPFPGRKEAFMLACKYLPLFYPNPVLKKEYSEWQTHIYIDLSGSTSKYWHILYGLILALKDSVSLPVYGFSNKVFKLNIDEIKEGKIKTTYGTDFDCIINHAFENGFKRILIVTDGYAELSVDLLNKVKRELDIFTIFTIEKGSAISSTLVRDILGENAENSKWWSLPEISEW